MFFDTWAWVAVADKADAGHQAVLPLYAAGSKSPGCVVTSELVIGEIVTILFNRLPKQPAVDYCSGLMEAVRKGFVAVECVDLPRLQRAWDLRRKYADRPKISFVDFTSMVVMDDLRIRQIVTHDEHFEQVGRGYQRVP